MGLFELIILIVIISTAGKIGLVVADHLGEMMKEIAAERRARREALQSGGSLLDGDAMEELERRLNRIEDRLDFLEELKAPTRRPAIEPPGTGGERRDGS